MLSVLGIMTIMSNVDLFSKRKNLDKSTIIIQTVPLSSKCNTEFSLTKPNLISTVRKILGRTSIYISNKFTIKKIIYNYILQRSEYARIPIML